MKDQHERIAEMEAELRARGATFHIDDDLDDDMCELFLRDILLFEEGPRTTFREYFGDDVPQDLPGLIERLASMNIVIENTDHLDDATLLARLEKYLDEGVYVPCSPETITHIDMTGGGSDEEIAAYLRYFADDEYRAWWTRDFPDYDMPPRERPPYDRDRFLPKAEELRARSA